MNIVIKYVKKTMNSGRFMRLLFNYRKDFILTNNKNLKSPYDAYKTCTKFYPFNEEAKKMINRYCDGYLGNCEKCWETLLLDIDKYIDKDNKLPEFMKQAKKINNRKPNFLKR